MTNPMPDNQNLQMYPEVTTQTNMYWRERYPDFRYIYTDGSKPVAGVGAAARVRGILTLG